MHDAFQHVADHIGYDMALAPFDLFACIIAARTTSFCRLYRLAIDNGCRQLRPAAFGQPCHRNQNFIDKIEQAAVPHPVEMVLHCRERREFLRQLRPLAARCRHILDRIPQRTWIMLARTSDLAHRLQKRRHNSPFIISTVACIA
ncbi:hypothetical protein D3C80_1573300 [compost metagenome]